MRRALELAARGWGRVAPNPLVGAVVVDGDGIAGEGWHQEYGGPHAEVMALRQAGPRAHGATLYVTLEPCAHHGKTPPCTDAVFSSGISRVVFAVSDPNPKARGGGDVLTGAGVEVERGVEEERGRDLVAAFLHAVGNSSRPWIALKLAMSLDGAVADAEGNSQWITGGPARDETHRLRAGFDAIAVGSGTAIADDPQLTARGTTQPRRPPVRVVFDRRLRLSPESRLAETAREVPVWILCGPEAPSEQRTILEARGVRVLTGDGLADGLGVLRKQGIESLLCEGGAELAAALLDSGNVDRMYLFYAPVLLGPRARHAFGALENARLGEAHRWRILDARQIGADSLVTLAP